MTLIIKKAILPVAGLGTRTLPASKAIPKEMFPIVDKPVIQYLVEEASDAGIKEIIMVISKGKEVIKRHFSGNNELEKILEEKGKKEELTLIRSINNLAKIRYVFQNEPRGDGHAILSADKYINNETVAVLFGDDIVSNKKSALSQLLKVYEEKKQSVIAVTQIEKKETTQYGVIDPIEENLGIYNVKSLVEKPNPEDAPSLLGIIGKYIVSPEVYENLKKAKSGHDGEIRLIDGFIKTLKDNNGKIYACKIEGNRYDTGQFIGLLKANMAYAMQNPQLKPELNNFLKTIIE